MQGRMGVLLVGVTALLTACSAAAPASPTTAGSTSAPAAADSPSAVGTSSGTQSAGANAACSLVTKTEVETLFGKPAKDPEPKAGIGRNVTRCNYSDAGGTVLLTIEWTRIPDAAKNFESLRTLAGTGSDDVPGIGDRAYFNATGLVYLKGQSLVSLGASAYLDAHTDGNFDRRIFEVAKAAASRTN